MNSSSYDKFWIHKSEGNIPRAIRGDFFKNMTQKQMGIEQTFRSKTLGQVHAFAFLPWKYT